MEGKILNHINNSIKKFANIYKECYEDFEDEIDIHFYLYGLLFQMKKLIELEDYGDGSKQMLLHIEIPTINRKGRFDFVIYSPKSIKKDIPFVAIELKHYKELNSKKVKENIITDFKKLGNENIIHPIFIYVDRDYNKDYVQFFKEHKSPKTTVYYITPNRDIEKIE